MWLVKSQGTWFCFCFLSWWVATYNMLPFTFAVLLKNCHLDCNERSKVLQNFFRRFITEVKTWPNGNISILAKSPKDIKNAKNWKKKILSPKFHFLQQQILKVTTPQESSAQKLSLHWALPYVRVYFLVDSKWTILHRWNMASEGLIH